MRWMEERLERSGLVHPSDSSLDASTPPRSTIGNGTWVVLVLQLLLQALATAGTENANQDRQRHSYNGFGPNVIFT